jgi:hypothetical protein
MLRRFCVISERIAMFTDATGEVWFTPKEAAEFIVSISGRATESSLASRRTNGGGPPFRKVNGRIHYPRSGLILWVEAGTSPIVNSTSELKAKSKENKSDQAPSNIMRSTPTNVKPDK